jgi:hypothetical protein
MFHKIALLTALSFLCAGMILKISAWFRYTLGPSKDELRATCRVAAALRAIVNIALESILVYLVEVEFTIIMSQSTNDLML